MAVDRRLPPATRAVLDRLVCRGAWVLLALAALPFAFGTVLPFEPVDALPVPVQYAPLVASALVLGLPHGAVDHLVPARAGGISTARGVAAVVVLYAVLGGAYLALWVVAPLVAVAVFVGLTWVHWGQGDGYHLRLHSSGRYPAGRGHVAATLAVRGGLPMLVPLLAFPGQYRAVVGDLVGLFAGGQPSVAWVFAPTTRLVAGVAFAVLSVGTLAAGALAVGTDDPTWRVDAVETLLLWAFFLLVPPVFAVGLYFCLWHAARHVFRLVLTDGRGAAALAAGDVRGSLARFARDAAPLTTLSLVLLAAFAMAVPRATTGLTAAVALYLVFVACVTLPHVVVVAWMDRRQGVWTASSPPDDGTSGRVTKTL